MISACIIGRAGSKAKIAISRSSGIPIYKLSRTPEVLINYGLPGSKLRGVVAQRRNFNPIVINSNVGKSKLSMVLQAQKNGVLIPESKQGLSPKDDPSKWLVKLNNSIGGKGIHLVSSKGYKGAGTYRQKYINNRRYELRVHAFSWLDPGKWKVQKRLGDNSTIAWNFSNGGHFSNVRDTSSKVFKEAVEISKKILKITGLQFGAIDFIVDIEYNIYFIEINSAPGFTEYSESIYIEAFNALKKLSIKDVKTMLF